MMSWKSLFSKPVTVKKCLMIFLLLALAAAIVFVGQMAYVMFINPQSAFGQMQEQPVVVDETSGLGTQTATMEPEGTPIGTPVPTPDPEELLLSQADMDFLKDRVNILLIGADENEMREEEGRPDFRSDVLILLTLDLANKKADMISVPRDSYAAQYKTTGRWKINSCFGHGGGIEKDGFLYTRETVSMLFGGIPIPYHIGVQMDGLKKVVDIIGGIDYDVDVEIKLNGRVLEKGMQHLNGQQVLDYCRARKGISTDVGRIDRQQRILFTIFDQLKSQGKLTQVPELYNAMKEYLYTNLNLEQIAALAVFGLQLDTGENLNRYTLEGEYLNKVYNFSFYALHQQKKCDLIKKIFGITIKPDMIYDAAFIKVDWACIQGEKAIETAQSAIDNAPAWISTGYITSQIQSLSAAIDSARGGTSAEDAANITAMTESLLQDVQNLQNTAATQENGQLLPPQSTPEFPDEDF